MRAEGERAAVNIGVFALMAAASLAAFWRTAPGGFLSDDFGLIDNVSHHTFTQLFLPSLAFGGDKFIRPVSLSFLKANFIIFGLNPAGYWAVSVLVHALNGMLVFLVARLLSGRLQTAIVAGLIFIVIPLQGETVAWLSCVFDRLCLSFMLSGVYLYIVYRGGGRRALLALSLSSFVLALFSKEMALTFPALVLLVEAYYWEGGHGALKSAALRGLPYMAVLAGYLVFRFWSFHGIGGYVGGQGQSLHHLFDAGATWAVLKGLPGYLLFPANRALLPSMTPVYAGFGLIYLLAVAARAAFGRTDLRPLLFGAAWMLLTLVPVMSILSLFPTLIGSRFLYVPLAGFSIFMAVLFGPAATPGRYNTSVSAALLASLLAGYLVLDALNYKTWAKAYEVARSIPGQLTQGFPSLPAGADVYFIDVPDNISGALVYRNGLREAVNMAYGYEGKWRVRVNILSYDGEALSGPQADLGALTASKRNDLFILRYRYSDDKLITLYPR